MNKTILAINDFIWIVTAILCIFLDNPVITGIVIVTTIIYAIDLWNKFAKMQYSVIPFIKAYWLDILFLIPVCKIFRGFRILKVGKILRAADATCDFTEIAFRVVNTIKHTKNKQLTP